MAIYANGKTGDITYTCEMCDKVMTEYDWDNSDICPDCLEGE